MEVLPSKFNFHSICFVCFFRLKRTIFCKFSFLKTENQWNEREVNIACEKLPADASWCCLMMLSKYLGRSSPAMISFWWFRRSGELVCTGTRATWGTFMRAVSSVPGGKQPETRESVMSLSRDDGSPPLRKVTIHSPSVPFPSMTLPTFASNVSHIAHISIIIIPLHHEESDSFVLSAVVPWETIRLWIIVGIFLRRSLIRSLFQFLLSYVSFSHFNRLRCIRFVIVFQMANYNCNY